MEIKKSSRVTFTTSKSGFVSCCIHTEYENIVPDTNVKVRKEVCHFSFIAEDESMVVDNLKIIIINLIKTNNTFATEMGTHIVLFDKNKKEVVMSFDINEPKPEKEKPKSLFSFFKRKY